MTVYYTRSSEKPSRRRLRREMPPSEALLWSRLRGRQLLGAKFRRQYSVGPFVVDFYCPEQKLAIELDGDSHFAPGARSYDRRRQLYIESFGIRVLRFTNQDIHDNLDGVLEAIVQILQAPSAPAPQVGMPAGSPPRQGESEGVLPSASPP